MKGDINHLAVDKTNGVVLVCDELVEPLGTLQAAIAQPAVSALR